ncbi:MAG: ABC transporter [Desulfobulbus propionicus]|nr:MAG: ABC transporter [Desulfobulbus propionicus]
MNQLIPAFSWQKHIIDPWMIDFSTSTWIVSMGFFVTAACGLVGIYLLLRRMALVGDAISHSVLPGLIVAFILFRHASTPVIFSGALGAGLLTVAFIEFIHKQSRVKPDAAICISFTILFAIGVAMMSNLETHGSFHIDADCLLYGEIVFVSLEPHLIVGGIELGPPSVLRMGAVLLVVIILITFFYKELLLTSFDQGLAKSLGFRTGVWHYGLMGVLSIVIVAAFEAVGAILVVAMLIVPPMFAAQLSDRMFPRMLLVVLHAFLSSLLGYHLSVWLACSAAGAMVVVASLLFVIAWVGTLIDLQIQRRRLREAHTQPNIKGAAVPN